MSNENDTETGPRPESSPDDVAAATPSASTSTTKESSLLSRAFSKQNQDVAIKFFTAYGQTWVGLSPVWLMGEALTPGVKVGTQFKKGKAKLLGVAEEIRAAVATSSRDVVVIVDQNLSPKRLDTGKTAEVLKAAGENAILVVSTSLEKAQAQLRELNAEYGPKIRKSVRNNGRDVIVVLDKALKHPLVITGVTKFARSKGIPHADALLRLGSLALARILKAIPEESPEGAEAVVEEIDAAELERTSTSEEMVQAEEIGKRGDGEAPKVAHASDKAKTSTSCALM